MALLCVEDLSVAFSRGGQQEEVVHKVSFSIKAKEVVALIGESGSGKSVTALSVLQLLSYPTASHPSGSIVLDGQELMGAEDAVLRSVRGNVVSMIFQEPMTSLNPLHTIGKQISEVLLVHRGLADEAADLRVKELLSLVGLSSLHHRLGAYPHELSGGQRQRVMIAMALANEPDLLIADEPTTALDVTVQKQIIALLLSLRDRLGMAILFITHDLSLVQQVADRVCVMKDGTIVEQGTMNAVFKRPKHAYTKLLISSVPKGKPVGLGRKHSCLLEAKSVSVRFPVKKGLLRRTVDYVMGVDCASFMIPKGATLGVIGESGSGKTTLANALLQLQSYDGEVLFDGQSFVGKDKQSLRALRKSLQVVFQDPFSSLNPRMSVRMIIEEGLLAHGIGDSSEERCGKIVEVLEQVGLTAAMMERYPHEFSGGQRQRIAIARALVLEPSFIVLDEPTSALDVTVQAQLLDLLKALQQDRGLTYMFISHDFKVVRAISHYVLVLKDGKVVEYGLASQVLARPQKRYTKSLIKAALG